MIPSTPEVRPIASSHLDLQRRMHPEIADLMRATLYPFMQVCQTLQLMYKLIGASDQIDLRTMR